MKIQMHTKRVAVLIASVTFCASALAVPSFKDCGFQINTPANGGHVYFDESCDTAYVAPPVIGNAELRALAPNLNLQFCPTMAETNDIAQGSLTSIKHIQDQINTMIVDYKPLQDNLKGLESEHGKIQGEMDQAQKNFDGAQTDLKSYYDALTQLKIRREDCLVRNAGKPDLCNDLAKKYDDQDAAYTSYYNGAYRDARNQVAVAQANLDDIVGRIAAVSKEYSESLKPLLDLESTMQGLQAQNFAMYQDYVALEGANGQLIYSIDWSKLVDDFKKANPKLAVNFVPISVREGTVWANLKSRGAGAAPELPALLSSDIPGMQSAGLNGMGKGLAVPPTSAVTTADSALASTVMNSVTGQIELSLAGACPFFTSYNEPSKNLSPDEMSALLAVNATFTYDVSARRGYTASYNLAQMMSRFESLVKHGGFFSTSTVHTVIEDNNSSDWFKITFNSEANEFQYTPQEQADLAKTVKAELIDRALRQVANFNAGSAPALPAVGGTDGSGAISSALGECPLWYCQAGSLVFGVLDSIFGSSSAVSDFKRNNNVWVTDAVNGIRIVDRSSTVTFGRTN